jgi:sensor histidine kinase YesM
MLVQPVVENALKHGLEPKVEGGEIRVAVEEQGDRFRLMVSDTGAGLMENTVAGVGLANVKERLATLYGDKGRLILEDNHPSGLRVTMEIPRG